MPWKLFIILSHCFPLSFGSHMEVMLVVFVKYYYRLTAWQNCSCYFTAPHLDLTLHKTCFLYVMKLHQPPQWMLNCFNIFYIHSCLLVSKNNPSNIANASWMLTKPWKLMLLTVGNSTSKTRRQRDHLLGPMFYYHYVSQRKEKLAALGLSGG